tara:strand:- start:4400 stop:5689 length:1290 start_codon:yes stop_codon:yes gene_type:complete
MAGTLEVGKLLTASWLYRYWNETSFTLKAYLSTAVFILMVITSMGIFGYLSKAHLDQASESGDAFAIVERIDGQIGRQENKIATLEDRILGIGGTVDVSQSIAQQEDIRDGAWARVQGDIEYAQGQIQSLRDQLAVLDKAVNDLRNKGVEVITTDEGGLFQGDTTEKIDYVAQANDLFKSQKDQRDSIKEDIDKQQDNIDGYRAQAQRTIDNANAEINKLRNSNTEQQDANLLKIEDYNGQIDAIYIEIATLKDEKYDAESVVRTLEKEVGPIKYVAQLLFGGDSEDLLDKAVQVFILMLVFVFDPLAVMLIIAANQTLLRYGINLEKTGPDIREELKEVNQQPLKRQSSPPSAVDDAADVMSGYKQPAPMIVEKEVIKEVPVEVIREVEKVVEKEVEAEIDLSTPPAIKELEKRLEKKLKKDDKKDNS